MLYPERFGDINPAEKADEIFTFFVGEPVFDELSGQYGSLGFARIPV